MFTVLHTAAGIIVVAVLPDVNVIGEDRLYSLFDMVPPDVEVMYTFVTCTEVARFGKGPAWIATFKPMLLQNADFIINGEKPEEVKVTLEEGLKIPMLYRITATMTMIRIAQP